MDGDRSLFDEAGADAVRVLHLLGPHAAEPSSPIFERLACASSPRCSTATPELSQNKTVYRASRTTLYNSIDLLLRAEDELIQRFAMIFQLTRREDAGRVGVNWIDAVFVC